MKVAVETTPLYTGQAGVARYVRGLLAGMKAVLPAGDTVTELGWPVRNVEYAQPARAMKTLGREWGWAKFVAPRRARDCDVVHHTALPIIPFFAGPRHVLTLHDLALLRFPGRFRRWQRQAGIRRLRRIARADRIICVSQFTADEAIALLGLPAKQIDVVHEGGWIPGAITDGAEDAADFPPDYFLFVGSLEPGKNLALLRQVYAAAEAGSSPLPPLLIAGARWAGVEREGTPPRGWHYLGYVSDERLVVLYRKARALVFPSRYEGFGLPLVEAMALGCPVICGAVASLPEIGGDAVCYAELAPEALGEAMRRVLSDDEYANHLRASGFARAKAFSWAKCARETWEAYRAAAG